MDNNKQVTFGAVLFLSYIINQPCVSCDDLAAFLYFFWSIMPGAIVHPCHCCHLHITAVGVLISFTAPSPRFIDFPTLIDGF